jgi:hypothetical protein
MTGDRADAAEDDAVVAVAIPFAESALEEAEYTVLNATLARWRARDVEILVLRHQMAATPTSAPRRPRTGRPGGDRSGIDRPRTPGTALTAQSKYRLL